MLLQLPEKDRGHLGQKEVGQKEVGQREVGQKEVGQKEDPGTHPRVR